MTMYDKPEFKTSELNRTVSAGGRRVELEYHHYYLGAPLRGKYRPGGKEYAKGGDNGNGTSRPAKKKVSQIGQPPPKPMVLVVDARTGRSHFEAA
jgi:hypothetical protein